MIAGQLYNSLMIWHCWQSHSHSDWQIVGKAIQP